MIEDIKTILAAMSVDYAKFEAGNGSAGTRVRKDALEIIKLCKALRELVLSVKVNAKRVA